MRSKFIAMTAVLFALSSIDAAAATYSFTEGNGDNRPLVDGSIDLEDSSPSFDLNVETGVAEFGAGDTLGIYGRIVGAVDRLVFNFNITSVFNVNFDFDGYMLDGGGTVADGWSGLIDQAVVNNATDPATTGGGKGVIISLLDDASALVDSKSYTTNVTSLTASTASIFSGIGPGTYTLVVDGSVGPSSGTAALYDIEISAVPLPAAGWMLLAGVGGMVAMRRRQKG